MQRIEHDAYVEWRPPKSLAEQHEWAKAHPWLAGCEFGVMCFVLVVVLGLEKTTLWRSIFVGAVVSAVAALSWVALVRFGTKRQWGEHPNADALPPPTVKRMWSRASDRYLWWTMILSALVFVVSAAGLATNSGHPATALVGLVAATWFVVTAWLERRRRRRVARL
jgi:hypothetical protein